MTRGSNVRLDVNDVFLDTQNKVTYKVTRLIGNKRIEAMNVDTRALKVLETDILSRGIASGLIRRVTFPTQ